MTPTYHVQVSVRQQVDAGCNAFRVHVDMDDPVKDGDEVVVIDLEATRVWGKVLFMEASPFRGSKAFVFMPDLGVTFE